MIDSDPDHAGQVITDSDRPGQANTDPGPEPDKLKVSDPGGSGSATLVA